MENIYKKAIEDARELAGKILDGPNDSQVKEYVERRSSISKINTRKNWIKFWFRANAEKVAIYSTAAASLIIFFSLFNNYNVSNKGIMTGEIPINLMPAQGAVTLKLASGEILEVDSLKNFQKNLTGIKVDSEKGEISYESTNLQSEILQQKSFKTEYNELSIPKGRSYSLVLSDGTKVWLNALSKLSYPVSFTSSERRVIITGEALFDVTRDESKPFIVETSDYEVRVLGTKFNVNAYPEEKITATTLVSGSIEIPGKQLSSIRVKAGEQYRYNKEDRSVNIESVDTDLYTSWRDDILRIENMSLSAILNIIQRRYDIKVELLDKSAGEEIFTGKVPLNDNLGIILEQLEKVSDVVFSLENGILKVKTK
ncbi:MAG: FecR domain-containing protein [Bacteroidales bacterium]|jgi:hypothetical protein